MATVLGVFKVVEGFSEKTSNQRHSTNGIILVFNESAIAKIALCTYLRMTLNGNFVGLA